MRRCLLPCVVQLWGVLRSGHIFGCSLLAKAFDKDDDGLFEAVLEGAWKVLDQHQVCACKLK